MKSRFFGAILSHDFVEASDKKISLPEDGPHSVKLYVQWLYTGKVLYDEDASLAAACCFADKVCDEAYQNELMDSLIAYYAKKNLIMNFESLLRLHQMGLHDSAVFKFGIMTNVHQFLARPENWDDKAALWKMLEVVGEGQNDLIRLFIKEIVAQQKNNGKVEDPRKIKGCHFHNHTNGSPCSQAAATT